MNTILFELDLYIGEKSTRIMYPPQQDKGRKIIQKALCESR